MQCVYVILREVHVRTRRLFNVLISTRSTCLVPNSRYTSTLRCYCLDEFNFFKGIYYLLRVLPSRDHVRLSRSSVDIVWAYNLEANVLNPMKINNAIRRPSVGSVVAQCIRHSPAY